MSTQKNCWWLLILFWKFTSTFIPSRIITKFEQTWKQFLWVHDTPYGGLKNVDDQITSNGAELMMFCSNKLLLFKKHLKLPRIGKKNYENWASVGVCESVCVFLFCFVSSSDCAIVRWAQAQVRFAVLVRILLVVYDNDDAHACPVAHTYTKHSIIAIREKRFDHLHFSWFICDWTKS